MRKTGGISARSNCTPHWATFMLVSKQSNDNPSSPWASGLSAQTQLSLSGLEKSRLSTIKYLRALGSSKIMKTVVQIVLQQS